MDDMKKKLADNYAEYLKVDIHDEISSLEETVEDMLTRLEEFESLMEGVHTAGTTCLLQAVPQIQTSCYAMETLFERVDQIESLVARVRKDLTGIEARLEIAESETGSSTADLSSLRSFLKPLFYKKMPDPGGASVKSPVYDPPDIFSAAEYFPPIPSPSDN